MQILSSQDIDHAMRDRVERKDGGACHIFDLSFRTSEIVLTSTSPQCDRVLPHTDASLAVLDGDIDTISMDLTSRNSIVAIIALRVPRPEAGVLITNGPDHRKWKIHGITL